MIVKDKKRKKRMKEWNPEQKRLEVGRGRGGI
jgi:hypothetical protein